MSLDIGIADTKTTSPYPAMSVAFDDDGYYWFCYPFFEKLHDATGEMIDLYGGAWFSGPTLDTLLGTLDEITTAATAMPEQWDVCIGHMSASEPIYSAARRTRLLELLEQFRSLAQKAKHEGKWIACLGD